MTNVVNITGADDLSSLLGLAFPKAQHPVTAWRIIVRGEALWRGPTFGPDERRPEVGPAARNYVEHVHAEANRLGYASGFGLSQVYEMMKRVKFFDSLDPSILDYLEAQIIPRAGLAGMLDGLRNGKATADDAMSAVRDWLAERGLFAKSEGAELSALEKAVGTLRSLLGKLPIDTIEGKRFRAEAIELLCAS